MLKRTKKIIFMILILLLIVVSAVLIYKTKNKEPITEIAVQSTDEFDSIKELENISECSEEFMSNYFAEIQSTSSDEEKENMLIIISPTKIENTYGAKKIIEAPNNQYILQYESKEKKDEAFVKLSEDDLIYSVEENDIYTTCDTEYNSWGIKKMSLDYAIECTNDIGANDVTVAVIDTGCNVELVNKYYPGKISETYDVLHDSTDNMRDTDGHGTHIAGTIAEGTPSNVKIIPVKASTDGGFYHSDLIAAVNYITYNRKADVINMSFGGGKYDIAFKQAIDSANENNIICVAAAGNNNSSFNHYPSGYKTTISIASVDSDLTKSSFSNYGASIDFCAPGRDIKSTMGKDTTLSNNTDGDDDFETISGTSMATPHAVCAVAILKSYNKELSLDDVKELLKKASIDLGDKGWDKYYGYGFISFDTAEFRDGEDHDKYNVFRTEIKDRPVIKIEAIDNITPLTNYGNITNILNAEIKIYYEEDKYYTSQLWELDEIEILGYEPYNCTMQEITVNYRGKSTTVSVDNTRINSQIGWEYEVLDDTHISLTKFKAPLDGTQIKKVYVPNQFDGYTVREIGESLFRSKESISYVILPETITRINDYAFAQSGIKEVKSPEIEIEIGAHAFENMQQLVSFTGIVKSMGDSAFANSQLLDNIVLSDNLETISTNAFFNDVNLEHINIPQSIIYIGHTAFDYTKINSIVIPSGVTKIEKETFMNCSNLESVTLSENLTEICENAFSYTNIRELYIPKNLTNINKKAFFSIGTLEKITVNEENPVYDSRDNCNAIIDSLTNTVFRASNNTVIPQSVTKIGFGAYSGARIDNLSTSSEEYSNMFTVPEHITDIDDYAFYESNYYPIKLGRNISSISNNYLVTNKSSALFLVYSDSYAKEFLEENGYNYRHINPNSVLVSLPKKDYKAFESLDTTDMYAALVYQESKRRTEFYNDINELNIIYEDNNRDYFIYGDTHITVSFYSLAGESIEKQVNVTVTKATPEYIRPDNITAQIGQKLSEIALPNHFEWMNGDITIDQTGNITYKAKYIPEDMDNYEIVEDIDISVLVENAKTVIYPDISLENKTYDGTTQVDISDITVSNLINSEYSIVSAVLSSADIGERTATIKLRLSDEKYEEYSFDNGKQEKEFEVDVNVLPLELIKPTLVEKEYVYNGNEQTIELNNFVADKMNISGNKRTNAGEQSTTISLKNNNYIWNDGTRNNIEFTFKINKSDSNIKYSASNMIYKYDEQFYGIELNLESPSNAIIKYANENDEYILDEMPQYNEIGTYTIKYRIYINDNYTDIFGENTLAIVENYIVGDINGDGKVNIKDWNRLYNHINETEQLNEYELLCADINGDGKVNIKDWNRMYDHITEVNPLW